MAVGNSLWSALSGVGWPYDNDRFLANILVGGDAEAAIAKPDAEHVKDGSQAPST